MNELLNRLKNSVNLETLNKVNKALMEQYKFVPLSVRDDFLYVVICSASNKDEINKKLKEIFPYQIKFFPVPDQDLTDLIASFASSGTPQDASEAAGKYPAEKKGDISYGDP